ncbi:MAG: cell division protein FtsZ [Candidatus Freyrarchaeum guaymaensis]|nr:cell division protein FtsZ [Candidatus Sigynarchaeota archaeon]
MTINSIIKDALQNARATREQLAKKTGSARILVVGTGGAGNNTVNRIMQIGIQGAKCIAVNTDQQHLDVTNAHLKLLIGKNVTRGLGAGGYPRMGEAAAEESREELTEILSDADLVFVACGMGGGTGTGSAPIIADIAKKMGSIVVGVVTMPFNVERGRIIKAKQGLRKLRYYADTVVVIDNNRLLDLVPNLPIEEAFSVADEILANMVKGITECISIPSLINLDYADVRSILTDGGVAMVGIGEAEGENRVERAVQNALDCPLLDVDIVGATGALIHVTGGSDLTLAEATGVAELITDKMIDDANVIWGARKDPRADGMIRVILILTGVSSPQLLGPTDVLPDLPSLEPIRDYGKRPSILRDNEPLFPVFSEENEKSERDLGIPRI